MDRGMIIEEVYESLKNNREIFNYYTYSQGDGEVNIYPGNSRDLIVVNLHKQEDNSSYVYFRTSCLSLSYRPNHPFILKADNCGHKIKDFENTLFSDKDACLPDPKYSIYMRGYQRIGPLVIQKNRITDDILKLGLTLYIEDNGLRISQYNKSLNRLKISISEGIHQGLELCISG